MANDLDSLIAGIQNYVVAPINAFGLGGLVFDVAGESMATLSADITDHFSEDNKAIQDHMAIRPKRITLKGYVGELVYTGSGADTPGILQTVVQKLTVISALLPQISAAATQAQAALADPLNSSLTLETISGALPGAANIYGLIKNLLGATGNQAKQQNAYNYFAACQSQKILMGIQTPWEFLTNMAVETIVAIQGEDSLFITDFSITFKQIRIANTQTAGTPLSGTGGIPSPGGLIAQGVTALQSTAQNPLGAVSGLGLPTSLLPASLSGITGAASLHSISGIGNLFSATGK